MKYHTINADPVTFRYIKEICRDLGIPMSLYVRFLMREKYQDHRQKKLYGDTVKLRMDADDDEIIPLPRPPQEPPKTVSIPIPDKFVGTTSALQDKIKELYLKEQEEDRLRQRAINESE